MNKPGHFILVGKGRNFDVHRLEVGRKGWKTEKLEGCQRQISPPSQFFCSLALSIVMTQPLCAWQGSNKNSFFLVPNQNRESLDECQMQVLLINFEWSSLLDLLINRACLSKPCTLLQKHNRHILPLCYYNHEYQESGSQFPAQS